ncbi:MAG: hypothetical protein K6E13_08845 [Lachnospiraceae bacterium]|nr:hypothetical protein [Lachnospiraceae bacterium]
MDKEYEFSNETDEGVLIFIKYLGDNRITLKVNTKTKESKKYVCDYRKEVEVELDEMDERFIDSALNP